MIQLYERVKITACKEFPEYIGLEGIVDEINIESDGTIAGYSLDFEDYDVDRCYFQPTDLEGTGEVLSEEEFMKRFYGDLVFIKVRVDAEGNGSVASED